MNDTRVQIKKRMNAMSDSAAPGASAEPKTPVFSADLLFEDLGQVARLTLNRPAVMNALSIQLSDDLIRAFSYLRDTERFKIVVITGAGNTFCAGDDLTEMADGAWGQDTHQVMRRVRLYQRMADTLDELDKITISAVDGYCVGGGLELTMACDLVICTERARWGMPEVDWGITPGWGGTTRMARLIGRRMTKEINMLGALHSARRGFDLGMFNRVVANDALESETGKLVDLLLMKNQHGLRQLKFVINNNVEADLKTAQAFEVMGAGVTMGIRAFPPADSDANHGWPSYKARSAESLSRKRREAAIDFWTD